MATKLALCPSCGKTVYFQAANNLAACSCGKVWYRSGDVLTEVKMQQIHGASDVIQPGTTGSWKGIHFSVTGRLRLWFESSVYNYWTLDSADGAVRYLAEGYGMYAVYEALALNPAVVSRKFLIKPPANQLDLLDEGNYVISARNKAKIIELEGAVTVPLFPAAVETIEANSDKNHIEIIAYGQDFAVAYTVHGVAPESLLFENTRDEKLRGRKFSCHHCSTETFVSTYPYGQSWVCEGCSTCYSLENGGTERLDHGHNTIAQPLFTLKTAEEITIHGVTYTVVGVSFKQNKFTPDDYWREYTLYEKFHGFAFLTESQGHWTLLKETQGVVNPLRIRDPAIRFQNKLFRKYTQYNFKLLYASGEFPGDIFTNHQLIDVTDYIAPPNLLSVEKDMQHNVTWFTGEYIESRKIQSQTNRSLPSRVGMAPAEVRMKIDMDALVKSAVIGVVLVLFVQLFTGALNMSRILLNSNYHFADSLYSQTYVTEKFELEKRRSNIELEISAPVNNAWFELNATLVNSVDGTEYSIEQGVEYYFGSDSDGSWSEGGTTETAYFKSIPAGTYFLQLNGMRGGDSGTASYFSIKASYDVPMYRNFLIIMFLVMLWPIILAIADYNFEHQRWADSPFSDFSKK